MLSLSSVIVTVFVCLRVWADPPTFKCSDYRTDDCDKIGFCIWDAKCTNDTYDERGIKIRSESCSGACRVDPCLKILRYPNPSDENHEECPDVTGTTCDTGTTIFSEHYCEDNSTESVTNKYSLCQISGKNPVSACFLSYFKTGNCTVVDGQYCKLYNVVGGQICENVKSYSYDKVLDIENCDCLSGNLSVKKCNCLSVKNCKYNPACYISGSSCESDPCYFYYHYNILTQKCESDPYYNGTNEHECVPKAVTQVIVNYDYENKTESPVPSNYDDWTYIAKQNHYFTSYICIDEKKHTTPPNTCYNLSFSIFRNPTIAQQTSPYQPTSWWNYGARSTSRDGCNWWTGTTVDASACTNQTGCSVVDVGADKICTSNVSAGSSFVRSPSFVFMLIFVGVLSLLSN